MESAAGPPGASGDGGEQSREKRSAELGVSERPPFAAGDPALPPAAPPAHAPIVSPPHPLGCTPAGSVSHLPPPPPGGGGRG